MRRELAAGSYKIISVEHNSAEDLGSGLNLNMLRYVISLIYILFFKSQVDQMKHN